MIAQIWSGLTYKGKPVYTNKYARWIEKENLQKAHDGIEITSFVPQEGFQEEVCYCPADVAIIGGKRGSGKSLIMNLLPVYGISNPLFSCHGFRREKADLENGLWATSQILYQKIADGMADMEWKFPSGARITYEHMAIEDKADQRYRGVEIPYIIIDELPQFRIDTFFTLLASNRNTIGMKNRFVASCNPVSSRHWVHKFIKWYINEDTKTIIPERSGKIRYFYKYGKTIDEISWGNTKEEVYKKAKGYIDAILDDGEDYKKLIASFCFIEGSYSQNKIFKAKDPSYKGRLAQQGGNQSVKDIKGIWADDEESEALLSAEDIEKLFTNTPQTQGRRCCTADVALTGDFFVLGAWQGKHLEDFLAFHGVLSDQAVDICRNFLEVHSIREENFLYDENGLGLFLKGYFKKASGFNNKQAASNQKIWNNQKSECAEKFIQAVKQGKYSINPDLRLRMFAGMPFEDRLLSEKNALRRKQNDNGRFEIISKPEMKKFVGHSPDAIEMIFEREGIDDKKGSFHNIGML